MPPGRGSARGKGRLRKGGAGGNTQAGKTAALPPPRRAKTKPALRQQERPQRRARSPAGDVTTRSRAGATPVRAYIPRAQRAERKTCLREAPAPGSFPHRGNIFSIAWKNREYFSILWKLRRSAAKILDYGTDPFMTPLLKRAPHFTCSERGNRSHIPGHLFHGFHRAVCSVTHLVLAPSATPPPLPTPIAQRHL